MNDSEFFETGIQLNSDREKSPVAPELSPTEKNKVIGGTLYLVATPIGNLADMSARALKVLSEVDFIAAEDTRNSMKLLTFYGISKPMLSYFEHNKTERGGQIIKRLKEGQSCALITDAGTPAISDPGEDIVRLCAAEAVPVTAVPGCCAAVAALSLSALPTGKFVFEGFLSGTKNEKRARLEELSYEKRTVIIYEAPHRLRETLGVMAEICGGRSLALCRELTKINEEIMRTTVENAAQYYKEHEPRGEYVLVLDGATDSPEELFWSEMSIEEHVGYYMSLGNDKMNSIKLVARDRGVGKNKIYKEFVEDGSRGMHGAHDKQK